MRRVPVPPEPPSLASVRTLRERQAALDWFADPAHAAQSFTKPGFHAYSNDDVKATLDSTFHRKCAYCESYYGATMPLDVEHYRPKAGVQLTPGSSAVTPPGYYWLASQWLNLLPSCADCNRPRGQELPDNLRATAGKANRFPVGAEARRARRPGEEADEPRLLLHPYFDEPAKHLRFVTDLRSPRAGEVEPAPVGRKRTPSPQGQASIEVYALQRRGLVDARLAMLKRLTMALADVEDDVDEINSAGLTPHLAERFKRHVAELKGYARPDQEYSAMCAQMIDDAARRLFGGKLP